MKGEQRLEAHDHAEVAQGHAPVLVIVPTYNEAENLERMIEAILIQRNLDLLIIDDGSPDGTGELAESMRTKYGASLGVLHRQRKLGLGSAYVAGFRYALAGGYSHVVQMDCDYSHDPGILPKMLAAVQSADLVVGSRYVTGGSTAGWPLLRRVLSRGGSLYARLVLGAPLKDFTGGFMCFRKEVLAAFDLDAFQCNGFGYNVEMKWRCYQEGFRIIEIPITFSERQSGKSKMSARIFVDAVLLVWRLRLAGKSRRQARLPGVVIEEIGEDPVAQAGAGRVLFNRW